MRAIGFSTGALAKGDFRRGLMLGREAGAVRAVELSALREGELSSLIEAVSSLDLSSFDYVSFHAPSTLRELDEETVVTALESLPHEYPIVAHPEIIGSDRWRSLGDRLCIENMDNRKTAGRTTAELSELFERFPDAGFCLDVGHARQIDPTMNVAVSMLRAFGNRLRQIHLSEVGPRGEHIGMSRLAQIAFARLTPYLPSECPVIIESIVAGEQIAEELDAATRLFDPAYAEELRKQAFA